MKYPSLICLCVSTLLVLQFDKTDAVCRDKVGSCSKAANYCKLPRLVNTLKENCAATCGHCKASGTAKRRPGGRRKPRPKKEPTPKYTLHYFDFRFRAEPARMILNYAGVPFTDNRIKPQDFPALKSSFPNGQVPLLQIDNKNLTQSNAIYRYLGRKYGLMGKSELETAYLDQVAELFREMVDATTPYVQVVIKFRNDLKPDEEYKNKFVPAINKYSKQLEDLLDKSPSGFFGLRESWIDMYVADSILTMSNFAKAEVDKYPKILAHQKKVFGLAKLKNYINSRPDNKI